LLKHPEIILTPHLGASTEEAQVKVALELSQSMVDFFQNGFARQAVNLPPLDVAGQNQLLAFVGLAYKQGALFGADGEGAPGADLLRYSGELGRVNPALYTATAAAGYLSGLGVPATPVNALLLAQQRGLQIVEQVHPEAKDYASLLEMEATTASGPTKLAGTVYGRGDLRFVRIDDLPVDVNPQGYLMVMTQRRSAGRGGPYGHGVVGGGDQHRGVGHRPQPAGRGGGFLWSVDAPLPEDVLAKVKTHASILSVKMVKI
jgi:D-3-phosphoglycerate dehydrogenase